MAGFVPLPAQNDTPSDHSVKPFPSSPDIPVLVIRSSPPKTCGHWLKGRLVVTITPIRPMQMISDPKIVAVEGQEPPGGDDGGSERQQDSGVRGGDEAVVPPFWTSGSPTT